jgi:hypothetical protein
MFDTTACERKSEEGERTDTKRYSASLFSTKFPSFITNERRVVSLYQYNLLVPLYVCLPVDFGRGGQFL